MKVQGYARQKEKEPDFRQALSVMARTALMREERPRQRAGMVPHCERCRGLLYWTELREWDGSRGQDGCGALQCIGCGNIIDPVIVKNRRRVEAAAGVSGPVREPRWRRLSGRESAEDLGEPIGRER